MCGHVSRTFFKNRCFFYLRVEGFGWKLDGLTEYLLRHRRNSLFFRTSRGAEVGDILMSLMHTAERHDVNPLDYLVWLYSHADEVAQDPALWLPWHYTTGQRPTAMQPAA